MLVCKTYDQYASGPIGSLGDGCADGWEWGANIAAVVALATLLAIVPGRETVPVIVAYVLTASSVYHIVFGEARLADTGKWWKQAVNSREVTIPAQSAVLVAVYWWSGAGWRGTSWLGLYAAITLLGLLTETTADDVIDWLGACGGAALLVSHCRSGPQPPQQPRLL